MEKIFKNDKLFPRNFILLTSEYGENVEAITAQICEEALRISPESFNGENPCFRFLLRYCPPYEQENFRELKRFQEVAKSNVRFKDEYRGYIAISISEWITHLDEELFSCVTLPFLADMSDCWKYIFIAEGVDPSSKEIRTLNKYFKVKCLDVRSHDDPNEQNTFFETVKDRFNISFSSEAAELFRRFDMGKKIRQKETLLALGRDLSCYFSDCDEIDETMLMSYFADVDSVSFDLFDENDISEIQRCMKGGKGYDEGL